MCVVVMLVWCVSAREGVSHTGRRADRKRGGWVEAASRDSCVAAQGEASAADSSMTAGGRTGRNHVCMPGHTLIPRL